MQFKITRSAPKKPAFVPQEVGFSYAYMPDHLKGMGRGPRPPPPKEMKGKIKIMKGKQKKPKGTLKDIERGWVLRDSYPPPEN